MKTNRKSDAENTDADEARTTPKREGFVGFHDVPTYQALDRASQALGVDKKEIAARAIAFGLKQAIVAIKAEQEAKYKELIGGVDEAFAGVLARSRAGRTSPSAPIRRTKP